MFIRRDPKPDAPATASPTSPIGWSTPNASATPCASAPCSTSGATSTFPSHNGRCCAPASPTRLAGQAPAGDRLSARRRRGGTADRRAVGGARAPSYRQPGRPTCSRSTSTSLRLIRPRSVGVEQVGLWALEQVDLPDLLTRLGVNGALRAAAAGLIVGRLAQPASERATHRWLQQRSGPRRVARRRLRDRRRDATLPAPRTRW